MLTKFGSTLFVSFAVPWPFSTSILFEESEFASSELVTDSTFGSSFSLIVTFEVMLEFFDKQIKLDGFGRLKKKREHAHEALSQFIQTTSYALVPLQ